MGENSKIEWTDHTFNPWIGCTKVAAGCAHCYAESFAKRYGKAKWGPSGTRVKTSEAYWRQPLKWNREAEAAGERKRVFCASLADVFEDWDLEIRDSKGQIIHECEECGTRHGGDAIAAHGFECGAVAAPFDKEPRRCKGVCRVISLSDLRRDLFALIDRTPWLDWLLLTKRPENIRRMWSGLVEGRASRVEGQTAGYVDVIRRMGTALDSEPRTLNPHPFRANVWLLTSVAEQCDADRNVPELLKCRDLVPVLGLSCEPLVGPVNLDRIEVFPGGFIPSLFSHDWDQAPSGPLDWVIAGGESGPGARPMHPDWVRSLRDQCTAAGVAFHFKQWGEWAAADKPFPDFAVTSGNGTKCALMQPDGHVGTSGQCATAIVRVGKAKAGRLLDGREWNEFPVRVGGGV